MPLPWSPDGCFAASRRVAVDRGAARAVVNARPTGEALRALVVSDDQRGAILVGQVVERLGHGCELCGGAEPLARRLREHVPELVIIDGALGLERVRPAIGQLREVSREGGVQVLVLAPGGGGDDLDGLLDLAADDLVSRPLQVPELQLRIELAARRAAARRRAVAGAHRVAPDAVAELARRSSLEALRQHLRQACSQAAAGAAAGPAVLFLDLDRFRVVTDGLGHELADRLLDAIAVRLRETLPPTDLVARFRGDGFVVVAAETPDVPAALASARRLQQVLRQPFNLGGLEVFAGACLGVALWSTRLSSAEELLHAADTAMHRAKAEGVGRIVVFDQTMHRDAVATLVMEGELRRAVEERELEVYYQPIVDLGCGSVVGFEALVRWHHPRLGLLAPSHFIPLAEETGTIIDVDRWVLAEACRQLRAWQVRHRRNPPLTVNVNLSAAQFQQPDLTTYIDHVLRRTGLFGASLNLEITESLIVDHADHAAAMLAQLRRLDVGICIDDFGTGYSSLSYLRTFAIDTLKIDRSFVARIAHDPESREIVRTITTLAQSLGKVTVVEGVEDDSGLEVVRQLRPDRIQGYRVSVPLPASEAEAWLDSVIARGRALEPADWGPDEGAA